MDYSFVTTSVILVILLAIPVSVVVLSMCSYLGKVWAMRLMFRGKKEGGDL